jgi:hypothetical protein
LFATFRTWSANSVPPPGGLVGWWPGDGNANDIARTNNGSLSGGVTFAKGKVGQAFSFDGADGTVTVPDSSSLRLTTEFTIEAWINPHSTNDGDQAIVSKVGIANGNNGYQLYLSYENFLCGQFNSPRQDWPGNVIAYANSSAIVPNAWYHVAWTYDQSAMKLYLNGLPVATKVIGPQSIAVSSTDLRISGADNHVYFNGLIDEVSVYSRALSDNEIAAIYDAGSAGKCRLPRVSLSEWFSEEASALKRGWVFFGVLASVLAAGTWWGTYRYMENRIMHIQDPKMAQKSGLGV